MTSGLDIGLASDWILPGIYFALNFNAGQSVAAAGVRDVLIVGPKTSAGTYQVNQERRVQTEADIIAGCGAGSPAHRTFRTFSKASKKGRVYVLPYAATSGSGSESADGYIALSGTANGSGFLIADICGEQFQVNVSSGDTGSALMEILEAQVNARDFLPLTSNNSTGTLTLTAKIAGASQNGIYRFRASVTSGIGLTLSISDDESEATLGTGYGTPGAEGTETEQENFDAALATHSVRRYYIGHTLNTDAALSSIRSKIYADAAPETGHRQVSITANVGPAAAVTADALAINRERMQIVSQPFSEHDPAELIGQMLAVRSVIENDRSSAGLSSFRGNDKVQWLIKRVYSSANILTPEENNDLLTDGVTPIASDGVGSYLVKSTTTRSKNASGVSDDFRSLATHIVSVMDEMVDTMEVRYNNTFAGQGYNFRDDERDQNGEINPSQIIPARTTTPSRIKPLLAKVLIEFYDAGKITKRDEALDSLELQLSAGNSNRCEARFNVDVSGLLEQMTVQANEVGTA